MFKAGEINVFVRDIGNYASTFMVMYLLGCLLLMVPFMVLGLIIDFVLGFAFNITQIGGETNVLGVPGIGMSLAFIASGPLAVFATLWADPKESNIELDQEVLSRRMGGVNRFSEEP